MSVAKGSKYKSLKQPVNYPPASDRDLGVCGLSSGRIASRIVWRTFTVSRIEPIPPSTHLYTWILASTAAGTFAVVVYQPYLPSLLFSSFKDPHSTLYIMIIGPYCRYYTHADKTWAKTREVDPLCFALLLCPVWPLISLDLRHNVSLCALHIICHFKKRKRQNSTTF